MGALTPTGPLCEDAWLSTAMLCDRTERLKFLVAFRPGYYSPTMAAQMAATFQRHSQGRLMVNIVTGGESAEQRSYGDFLDKEGRYARTAEFLTIVSALWAGKRVDFTGTHLAVEGAALVAPPDPVPLIYFGGSSPAAMRVAARHADVYLTWGEPLDQVAAKLQRVRETRPRPPGAPCASGSACTSLPEIDPTRRGLTPPASSTTSIPSASRPPRPGWPPASRKGSSA